MIESVPDHASGAELTARPAVEHRSGARHRYLVECIRDGRVVWSEEFDNLVTTAGKNKYLDATLKTGLAAPAWFVGLVAGPGAGNTYAAADTVAAHPGWVEAVGYGAAARPAFVPGAVAAGSVSNSASKASFDVSVDATIAGAFMADDSTKGGAVGTLLGVGDFTGSDRPVQVGDTLNVTVTASQT